MAQQGQLIARVSIPISSAQMRLPINWWRDLDEPESLEISSLVETEGRTSVWIGHDLSQSHDETLSLYDRNQLSLPLAIWQEMGEPSEVTADLVKTSGELEVCLTS